MDYIEETQTLTRQAAHILLPYLLSEPPYTPANLTSKELNRRRRFLKLSPEIDAGQYLVTDLYSTHNASDVASMTLGLLRSLASQIEELSFANVGEASQMAIGSIRYRLQDHGAVLIAVDLGTPPLLVLLLRLIGVADNLDNYKYDNLLPVDVLRGPWWNSVREAELAGAHIDHEGRSQDGSQANSNGEQSSEYITNDDFWAGVEDSEDEDEVARGEEAEKSEGNGDHQAYWNLYGDEQAEEDRDAQKSELKANKIDIDQSIHDNAIKMIFCGAWKMMKITRPTMNDSQNEKEFMRLAKEAIDDCN